MRNDGDRPDPDGHPDGRVRAIRAVAITLTAGVALGAGAGAVLVYNNALAQSRPTAAPSAVTTSGPGQARGATVTSVLILGPVVAVSRGEVTLSGGLVPPISAHVTSSTRFIGSARSLSQVRVGDRVAAQITESGGRATVVSLQDPVRVS